MTSFWYQLSDQSVTYQGRDPGGMVISAILLRFNPCRPTNAKRRTKFVVSRNKLRSFPVSSDYLFILISGTPFRLTDTKCSCGAALSVGTRDPVATGGWYIVSTPSDSTDIRVAARLGVGNSQRSPNSPAFTLALAGKRPIILGVSRSSLPHHLSRVGPSTNLPV